MGTDVLLTGRDKPVGWGNHGARAAADRRVRDVSPLAAIEAATANGPDTLGQRAPRSGQLVAGYDADVIAVSGDPVADVSVLADPGNITHVWQAGELTHRAG